MELKPPSAYKVVSAGITMLSVATVIFNIQRFYDKPLYDAVVSLVLGGLGVGWFGISLLRDNRVLRYGQLIMMFLVGMFATQSNTNPFQGVLFLAGTICVAYAYDFYDRHTVVKILVTVFALFSGFAVVYNDHQKAFLTLIGFVVVGGLLGYILWDKWRRMKQAAREAATIAHEAIELVKKESQNG